MNEDKRFACNRTYTSSIMMFSKFCAAHDKSMRITSVISGQVPSLITRWLAQQHSSLFSVAYIEWDKTHFLAILSGKDLIHSALPIMQRSFLRRIELGQLPCRKSNICFTSISFSPQKCPFSPQSIFCPLFLNEGSRIRKNRHRMLHYRFQR